MKTLLGKRHRFSRPVVRRRARPSGNPIAAVESLEDRVLLSSVSVAGNTLVINGTNGIDGVWVNEAGDDVRVRISEGSQTVSVETYSSAGLNQLRINGRAGDDRIINKTDMLDIIIGGAGNDVLLGGDGGSIIFGGAGEDVILGRGGNDFLSGGEDRDGLLGGAGRDTLRGGTGNDRLFGEAGGDRVFAGDGNDFVRGGAGNDHLFGEGGIDRIRGEAGIDRIDGGDNDDRLLGQGEADLILGGLGDDILVGGGGDDILVGGGGENIVIDGDGGPAIGPPGPGTEVLPETGGEAPGAETPNQSAVEQLIISQTNTFRGQHGRAPLTTNATLMQVAQDYADFMAESGLFGHEADGRTAGQRISAAGYVHAYWGENIAWGFDPTGSSTNELATNFVVGWIESPGHRANMLDGGHTQIGVGIAKTEVSDIYLAVQVFARPR